MCLLFSIMTKQLLMKSYYYAEFEIVLWEGEWRRITKCRSCQAPSVHLTPCAPARFLFAVCGFLGACLVSSSFPDLPSFFKLLSLTGFHIFVCFTPCILCPTNFVPAFCWGPFSSTPDCFPSQSMPDTL